MQRDELVACCLAKPGAEETYPWGDAELVAKVGGKAFAFVNLEGGTVGLTCGRNAEEAWELPPGRLGTPPRDPPLEGVDRRAPRRCRPESP